MTKDEFTINPKILADGPHLFDLELSSVILVDNSYFPWVILVPRIPGAREFVDLSDQDRIKMMNEICFMSSLVQKEFNPHKLNVANLGNMVSQLHVHVVARYENDICWPAPVFGRDKKPYGQKELEAIVKRLRDRVV